MSSIIPTFETMPERLYPSEEQVVLGSLFLARQAMQWQIEHEIEFDYIFAAPRGALSVADYMSQVLGYKGNRVCP